MTRPNVGDDRHLVCVEPFRLMTAACPEIMPPSGSDMTVVMPFMRVTLTCVECGLMPLIAIVLAFIVADLGEVHRAAGRRA